MANTGINLNEAFLKQKYVVEGLSILKISKEVTASTDTIYRCLKKYGLNRNKSEAQKNKCKKDGVYNTFELDYKLLKELYLIKNFTSTEIAKIFNCSKSKIYTTLKFLGVNKTVSETRKIRITTDDTRLKLRLKQIEYIKDSIFKGGQIYPNYNKSAIKLIEEYGYRNDYNFQHAENGGEYYIEELGYWVDGYDKFKNVVLEFDEKHHKYLIIKDEHRQNEIINHLKCKFIRLDENGIEKLKIEYNE